MKERRAKSWILKHPQALIPIGGILAARGWTADQRLLLLAGGAALAWAMAALFVKPKTT